MGGSAELDSVVVVGDMLHKRLKVVFFFSREFSLRDRDLDRNCSFDDDVKFVPDFSLFKHTFASLDHIIT
jgi:hypothetical protein